MLLDKKSLSMHHKPVNIQIYLQNKLILVGFQKLPSYVLMHTIFKPRLQFSKHLNLFTEWEIYLVIFVQI